MLTSIQQKSIGYDAPRLNSPLTFAQFDPSLGTLVEVRLTIVGTLDSTVSAENLGPAASTDTITLPGTVTLPAPSGLAMVSAYPSLTTSVNLGAFDGSKDFAGSSIPVRYLANDDSVIQRRIDSVDYYHLELPRHAVMLAEGLAAESFLDTGNRSAFANGGVPAQVHPDFASLAWEAAGCAPLVVTGPVVEAARAQLRLRAKALARRRPRAA